MRKLELAARARARRRVRSRDRFDRRRADRQGRRKALFLDARTLAFEQLASPSGVELAVIDAGVAHAHATGEYRVRREECAESARRLGVRALRGAGEQDVERAWLPAPLDPRARSSFPAPMFIGAVPRGAAPDVPSTA